MRQRYPIRQISAHILPLESQRRRACLDVRGSVCFHRRQRFHEREAHSALGFDRAARVCIAATCMSCADTPILSPFVHSRTLRYAPMDARQLATAKDRHFLTAAVGDCRPRVRCLAGMLGASQISSRIRGVWVARNMLYPWRTSGEDHHLELARRKPPARPEPGAFPSSVTNQRRGIFK